MPLAQWQIPIKSTADAEASREGAGVDRADAATSHDEAIALPLDEQRLQHEHDGVRADP